MIWIEAISSSNRKRVTSTSCTSESRTTIALSNDGGTAGFRCAQCSTSGWPNSPPSMSAFSWAYSWSNRRMNPTWISRLPSSASRLTTASEVSTSVVNGFSQSTGLPCSRQASSCFSWVGPGVASTTASTSGSAIASSGSPTTPGTRHRCRDLLGLLGQVVVHDDNTPVADSVGDAGDVVGTHHAYAEHGNT